MTHKNRIRAAAWEAARRPYPWWEKGLLGRNEILAKRLKELAGQEAVLILGKDADPLYPVEAGPAQVMVSFSPVDESRRFGWAAVGTVHHGFHLDKVEGVLSLEEARECGVLP